MSKVLLLNGSARPKGATANALRLIGQELNERGVETTWFQLSNKPLRGCIACGRCKRNGKNRCVFTDDQCNELIEAILDADGVVIGTPTYFAGANGALTALLDRVFFAATEPAQLFRGKVGAAVATCLRSGATDAIDRLNKYFQFAAMPVACSSYWNLLFAEDSPVGHDEKGINTLKELAVNMSKML